MWRWDTGSLAWVVWDGSLTTGALTIGKVDQGTGGVSAWLTKAGFAIAGYDYVSLGYTGSNLTTVVFKSGGAGGTTINTLTLAYTGARLDSVTRS